MKMMKVWNNICDELKIEYEIQLSKMKYLFVF